MSQAHIDKFYEFENNSGKLNNIVKNPNTINNITSTASAKKSFDFDKSSSHSKKPKQFKNKWQDEEQALFIEGLKKYGTKSN